MPLWRNARDGKTGIAVAGAPRERLSTYDDTDISATSNSW